MWWTDDFNGKDTLVLFADAAAYNKSGNKSMYAIFSEIVELPTQNTIFHSRWSHSNPDFNIFLENFKGQLETLLANGIKIDGRVFKFKMHLLIWDKPVKAKMCKFTNFNEKYGCIKCMHPTIYLSIYH